MAKTIHTILVALLLVGAVFAIPPVAREELARPAAAAARAEPGPYSRILANASRVPPSPRTSITASRRRPSRRRSIRM